MEKQSKFLIILLVALVICIGVFLYQFNTSTTTLMLINETEITEGGSFSGVLMDAYSYGVANQTVTFQKPGVNGSIVEVKTDDKGEFKVSNAEYSSQNNVYTNFTFAGHGKYLPCKYEGNVTVKAK